MSWQNLWWDYSIFIAPVLFIIATPYAQLLLRSNLPLTMPKPLLIISQRRPPTSPSLQNIATNHPRNHSSQYTPWNNSCNPIQLFYTHYSLTPLWRSHLSFTPSTRFRPLTPSCHIAPLNIPEPTPHLLLFLFASELILPYESLRIRPPTEPPPQPRSRPSRPLSRPLTSQITSYSQRVAGKCLFPF